MSYLQGAITKRMTAIEEMAGMDVLCSDKTGTLTLNKLTVDKNLIEACLVAFLFYLNLDAHCDSCYLPTTGILHRYLLKV